MKSFCKIFITGGASSGKSGFAEKKALSLYEKFFGRSNLNNCHPLHFMATAILEKADHEMAQKIGRHKEKRSSIFIVHESYNDLQLEIKNVYDIFKNEKQQSGVILIDSLTLWLSSVFKNTSDFNFAYDTILIMTEYIKTLQCSVVTVTDTMAFNMVPADAYLRKFIELNGLMEQQLSDLSDEAYCIIAGNQISLK